MSLKIRTMMSGDFYGCVISLEYTYKEGTLFLQYSKLGLFQQTSGIQKVELNHHFILIIHFLHYIVACHSLPRAFW